MAKLVLRKLVFAALLLFATLISALSIQSTAAMAACPTQSVTLAIGGTLTTPDLITNCNDNGNGLFLSAAAIATQQTDFINTYSIGCSVSGPTTPCPTTPQTVTTTNATYEFTWDDANGPVYDNKYVIKLVGVGHNAGPNVGSASNLSGAAGVDSFTLYTADNLYAAHPVLFAITIPAAPVLPVVTSISPTTGPAAGGTSVSLTGTDFTGATSVKFGAKAATSFTVNSATSITALSPALAAGAVDIKVTTAGGTSSTSTADQFTYASAVVMCPAQTATVAINGQFTTTDIKVNCTDTHSNGLYLNATDALGTSNTIGCNGVSSCSAIVQTVKTTNATYQFTWNLPVDGVNDTYTIKLISTGNNASPNVASTNLSGAAGVDAFTLYYLDGYLVANPIAFAVSIPAAPVAPAVTNISPNSGTTAGGTSITITGTNFTGATSVKFGTAAATSFTVNSATSITATSSAGAAGIVDVTVTTPVGTSAVSATDKFTYAAPPVVTLNPSNQSVTVGAIVDITATASPYTFIQWQVSTDSGATFSDINAANATHLVFSALLGQNNNQYRVVFSNSGVSTTTSAATLTVTPPPPTVTSISPNSGTTAGGTSITITGTNFTGVTNVNFGATAASSFTLNSATSITATAPAAAAGIVDVTVTTPSGTSVVSAADKFTYAAPLPAIQIVSGQTQSTIEGTAFGTALSVKIVNASGIALAAQSVTFTAPSSGASATFSGTAISDAAGMVSMVATANGIAGTYSVLVSRSGSSSVNFNLTNTGAPQTITFAQPAAQVFGTTPTLPATASSALGVAFTSTTTSVCTITTGGALTFLTTGTCSINADQAGNASFAAAPTVTRSFAVNSPVPTVASVLPSSGVTAGGEQVALTGTNFTGATNVMFGAQAASGFIVTSATSITALSPAGSSGIVDVTVITPSGTSVTSTADQFTFVAPPTVTSLSPSSGATAGGTSITLTGTDFTGVNSVMFGSTAATSFTLNSGTSITAVSPAHGVGFVGVRVTTPFGTSAILAADRFTYVAAPTVTSLSKTYVPVGSSTSLAITGTGFTGATSVKFGATAASSFVVNSDTAITVTSPLGAAGVVDVTVTAVGGTSATSAADQFTYAVVAGAPTIGTATAGNGSASVTFTPPISNGGAPIQSYLITSNPGNLTNTSSASPITLTGLTNGTAYTFTVNAKNIAGLGPYSAPSNSVTPIGPQTITFNNPGAQNFGTTPTLPAAASSSLVVAFTSTTPSVCSITTGGTLAFLTIGNCSVNADQAGNAAFMPAPTVTQSFTVNAVAPAAPVIGTATAGNGQAIITFTPPATTGGSAITGYTVTSSPDSFTATGAASPITVLGLSNGTAYTFTVTASNVASTSVASAPSNSVTPIGPQTITFNSPGAQTYVPSGTFAVTATADSNLVVSFSVPSTTTVCSVTGNTVAMLSAGTCTVQADQAGNASFQPAASVSQNIIINQASQTISFTPVAAQTFTPSATFGLSATGGASGNAVVFASTTSGVCTVSGNTVSMVSAGTCTIAADQAGNANYAAATQVSQNITIGKAAQTISFTTSPPTVAVASGNGYSVAATGGVSGNPVVFSVDAASGAGVCSIAGSTVSFLTPGSCIIDANQAASTNYAAATQVQQTIAVQNSKGKTTQAIATFINTYDNQVVGNLFSMDRTIDRLEQADEGNESSTQFENSPPQPSRARAMLVASGQNGVMQLATGPVAGASASTDAYGMQQMLYNAMQQLGDTQAVNQLNYSGPFDASMNIHDLTGSFHTSLSQMIKWDDQRQQKDAESLGLNTSGHGPATFMPLDVWMQGSYAAVNATQQGTFGEISTGVDYVFNRNLLLGAFAQLDFMNQTTGPGAAGTGWLIGPYGTLRLTDHMFFEARGGYGRSNNTMADAVSPALQDQFGSTRLLASASLAGRWHMDGNVTLNPNLAFTYFSDSTDAFVNAVAVNTPSVTNQLGQVKFSPAVSKGFAFENGDGLEASLTPELIYNFDTISVAGSGNLDPTTTGPQGLRGAVKLGMTYHTRKGISIDTSGTYDGIGTNGYSAITATARLSVPLN